VSMLPLASITVGGGRRPPAPITVAAGSAWPADTRCHVKRTPPPGLAASSVVVRLAQALSVAVQLALVQPGRNSATVPLTTSESPMCGLLPLAPVKTKRPSAVAGLL